MGARRARLVRGRVSCARLRHRRDAPARGCAGAARPVRDDHGAALVPALGRRLRPRPRRCGRSRRRSPLADDDLDALTALLDVRLVAGDAGLVDELVRGCGELAPRRRDRLRRRAGRRGEVRRLAARARSQRCSSPTSRTARAACATCRRRGGSGGPPRTGRAAAHTTAGLGRGHRAYSSSGATSTPAIRRLRDAAPRCCSTHGSRSTASPAAGPTGCRSRSRMRCAAGRDAPTPTRSMRDARDGGARGGLDHARHVARACSDRGGRHHRPRCAEPRAGRRRRAARRTHRAGSATHRSTPRSVAAAAARAPTLRVPFDATVAERLGRCPRCEWDSIERPRRLVALLAAGAALIPVFETLDHVGLLVRLLPEWEHVRARPQRNAYHRFTVDRHSLEAVAECAAAARPGDRRGGLRRRVARAAARRPAPRRAAPRHRQGPPRRPLGRRGRSRASGRTRIGLDDPAARPSWHGPSAITCCSPTPRPAAISATSARSAASRDAVGDADAQRAALRAHHRRLPRHRAVGVEREQGVAGAELYVKTDALLARWRPTPPTSHAARSRHDWGPTRPRSTSTRCRGDQRAFGRRSCSRHRAALLAGERAVDWAELPGLLRCRGGARRHRHSSPPPPARAGARRVRHRGARWWRRTASGDRARASSPATTGSGG